MKKLFITTFLLSAIVLGITSCNNDKKQVKSDDEIVDIASKAYVYGFPLILMDLTKKFTVNVEEPNERGYAPINQFGHYRMFPDDKFTAVVKPNVDTYYSTLWLDLKAEPIVVSAPATDRYYLLPMIDAWSNVFASPGTRTTGTGAQDFLVAGPNYKGETPEGMTLIQAPTNMVWIIGRVQVNSPEDGATVVKEIQDGLKSVPLSQFGKEDYQAPKGTIIEADKKIVPADDIEALSIKDYFDYMSDLMVDNPPLPGDSLIVKDMASIGIVPGKAFDTSDFSEELMTKLNAIPEKVKQGFIAVNTSNDPNSLINGWSSSYQLSIVGNYGQNYDIRGLVAFIGLGANLVKDAVYPNTTLDSDGNLLSAENKYQIHFEKDQIPPANAFWSITMYNSRNFLVENPINRFAVGDRDNLKYNEDGSLDIYIQTENPGEEKESNWLPAPKEGSFELTMRLYWPKEAALNGEWTPAPVKKVE